VTNNVLLTNEDEVITEKYDLKGSSVHRHMKMPRDGESVRCQLCGNAFIYNSKSHLRRDNNRDNTQSATNSNVELMDSDRVLLETNNSDSSIDMSRSVRAASDNNNVDFPPDLPPLKMALSRRISRRNTNNFNDM
jgi:hypothetical protein